MIKCPINTLKNLLVDDHKNRSLIPSYSNSNYGLIDSNKYKFL